MTWPSGVAEELANGSYPLALRLEVLTPATGEGVAGSVPGWFASSTAQSDSYATILIRKGYRVSLGSAAIVPVSWQYVEGAWSLFIQIPEGRRRHGIGRNFSALAAQALRRGVMVRLSIGRQGDSPQEYAPLKLGRIYSVKSAGHPRTYRVEVWDIHTAFRSRMTATSVSSKEQARLFFNTAGAIGKLAGVFTPGVSTTIALTSGVDQRYTFESGQPGAVRITSNAGTDYFMTYTGTSGVSTLTGVSSSGQFGTTAGTAGVGKACNAVCLLSGHPVDILQKILTSTGSGTNGDFDVYPKSWGLAVPQEMISSSSFNQARQILKLSSGAYHIRLLIEAEQDDPSSFLSAIFGAFGIWFCVRQGQIVCRVARDPNAAGLLRQIGSLTTDDLTEVPSVEWYPTEIPHTFFRVKCNHGTSIRFVRSSTSTLPVREELIYDVSESLLTVSNAEDIALDVLDRLAPWAHLMAEYIEVNVRGIRSYAPGDIIKFTCAQVFGRLDGTREGYDRRLVMVIRSAMNLESNTTQLTLAALPIDLQEDGGAT